MLPGSKRSGTHSSLPGPLRDSDLPNVHLRIGEGIVTAGDMLISTVLGSCVSVSFFHAGSGLAGIFHAMLPEHAGYKDAGKTPCKFVDSAILLIYEQFRRRGVANRDMEIKLFGGAFSMGQGGPASARSLVDVGSRNVEVARVMLGRLGLSVSRENVLGDRGRKLVFDTRSGEIWLKMLGRAEGQVVLKQESVLVPVAEGRACPLAGR